MPTKAVVFIGDIHAGSKSAVAQEQVLDDGETYQPSLAQQWLLWCWRNFLLEVDTLTANDDLVLCLGGDLCDGVQHHGSTQTFGTEKDQINLAVEFLRGLNTRAVGRYGLRGTSAHGGNGANLDRQVYEELGFKRENIDYYHRIQFYDQLLDWRHHFSTSRLPQSRGNSLQALIVKSETESLREGEPKPQLLIRHHVHLYDDRTDNERGMRAISCPAWQLGTEFTHSLSNFSKPSIGGLVWWPEKREVKAIVYQPKNDKIKHG